MCGVIMFCSSNFQVVHSFSYVGFSAVTVAFVNNMGWVLVFVPEFENALNFPSLPQDVDRRNNLSYNLNPLAAKYERNSLMRTF